MQDDQPAMAAERERQMWRRYARTGHVLNLVIVCLDTAYVLATWRHGPHRPALLLLNAFGAVGMVVAIVVVPEAKLASSARRNLIFGSWMLLGSTLITLAAWADGGLRSPLAWLLPLSIMFTAVAHRPAMVSLSGGLGLAGYLILAGTDGAMTTAPTATALRAGYLLALTYAAVSGARSRWAHHDEQAALQLTLARLADLDGLTGLLNHRAFHERLSQQLDEATDADEPSTLLLLDLDHFKVINDRHGHAAGDEVLRQVAEAITSAVRAGDTTGRVGGEEFAVHLGPTAPSEAHDIAERLRAAVARIVWPEPITTSIGVGSSHAGPVNGIELLARADEALYAAKRQGRNRTCWLRVA